MLLDVEYKYRVQHWDIDTRGMVLLSSKYFDTYKEAMKYYGDKNIELYNQGAPLTLTFEGVYKVKKIKKGGE